MEAKTVIAIVLVMFIVGGAIWLNIRKYFLLSGCYIGKFFLT